MKKLNFYWRMGDYALEACPKSLARFSEDEPNVTIELVKYYQHQGRECKYVIGYFYYNTHEPCWELKFVGERFKDILDGDCVAIFKMLKSAYDTLEEWVSDGDGE
jgi:hypothetical protein